MFEKATYLALLLPAAPLVFPLSWVMADSPVTFEVIATFDRPGALATSSLGINDKGYVAGSFTASTNAEDGFVWLRDNFSKPIVHPEAGATTVLTGINNNDTVCGWYSPRTGGGDRSFLFSGSTFTDLNIGIRDPVVYGLNDAGNLCGVGTYDGVGFVVIDGVTTTFTIPGGQSVTPRGINNVNQCVGFYDVVGGGWAGFLRDADGTLIYPISASETESTFLNGLNDDGMMVGDVAGLRTSQGVLFQSPGRFVTYDYPGATTTGFTGINSRGFICGGYSDATGGQQFVVRTRSAAAGK